MGGVGSNNTNKLSPQELDIDFICNHGVQIIQINLVLKNKKESMRAKATVQIIQINLVLKNQRVWNFLPIMVQIIQINLVLKNETAV